MNPKNLMKGWALRGAWAGASLTVLLGAGSASAQTECPTPTLSVCQSAGYLASTCGQQHKSLCENLISEAFEAEWAKLTVERVRLLPESLGGGLATTRPTPSPAAGSTFVHGVGGSIAGTVLKNQNLHRKNFQGLNDTDTLQQQALQAWEASGPQVSSCSEYVYEKYLGYSRFEDRMGGFGTNYRGVFNAAYAQDGIANKTLYGRSGNALAPVFGNRKVPKNLYFLAKQGPYPAGTDGHTIDPQLLQQVPVEGRQYYTPSWSWHQEMSQLLANTHDEVLNARFARQLDFARVVAHRDEVWNSYARKSQSLSGPPLQALGLRVAEQLSALDQDIERRLREGSQLGCLGLNGDARCAWSPYRFKKMLDAEMGPRREADLQSCRAVTADDFSLTSFVRNADQLQLGLQGDYTLNTAKLEEYIATYRPALVNMEKLVFPSTQELRESDSYSDSGSFGNSYFSATYNYSAGWEFDATSALGLCTSYDARIYASLQATAKVFSLSKEIVYASAEAEAGETQLSYAMQLRVLGVTLYNPSGTKPATITVADQLSKEQDFFKAGAHFVIVAVPVSVTGGVTGEVGLDYEVTGALQDGCQFTLGAEVMPWASLDGFAEAAVDVGFASAGVRGDVTLIRVDLPLDVDLSIYLDGSLSQLMFKVDSNLRLVFSSLDGSLSLFIKLFGSQIGELQLVSFNGVSTETTLFDETRTVKLATFY